MQSIEMMHESIWFDRPKYEQEMENYQLFVNNNLPVQGAEPTVKKPEAKKQEVKKPEAKKPEAKEPNQEKQTPKKEETKKQETKKVENTLSGEIEKAREAIEQTLAGGHIGTGKDVSKDVSRRVDALEKENKGLKELLDELTLRVGGLETRLSKIEGAGAMETQTKAPTTNAVEDKKEPKKESKEDDDDDDDDFDLFDDDEEEEETEEQKQIREERLAAYAAKKEKKPAVIAKSSILLDVKPWDDETDLKEVEEFVRSIVIDGLVWGASKLVPLAYGIKKLQIGCVVEDDKVGTDILEEEITKFEDHVQSVDIAAFNKI